MPQLPNTLLKNIPRKAEGIAGRTQIKTQSVKEADADGNMLSLCGGSRPYGLKGPSWAMAYKSRASARNGWFLPHSYKGHV